MQDAGLMNLSNEGAQFPSQTMPHRDQSIPLQSGQSLFDKGAQRLGTIQTPGQEKTVARPPSFGAFGEAERGHGGNASCGHGQGASEFHGRLGRPDQLPNPRSHIADPVVLEIET